MATLISREELFKELVDSTDTSKLRRCLFDEVSQEDRTQNSTQWLSWVHRQTELKAVTFKVPAGILPAHLEGNLTDVKVSSKGPDDKVYDKSEDFRQCVARGNCILEMKNKKTGEYSADCVIFALKKFTGGLGDDDDRDIGDGFKWQKYFTKPITHAERVICTKKMNGEAAHFAVRWFGNDFYIIAGSKNVHLVFRTQEDIDKYSESRFLVARDVASTCLRFFEAMDVGLRCSLFSFFHHTKYTAVLEILLPHYQHVEDLSYLPAPELYFISWSKTDFSEGYKEEICISPDFGQKIAQRFQLKVTGYDAVLHADLADQLLKIRRGHGYEGEVLYFVDKNGDVIGLLKKKTIWYIIIRALREKAKNAASEFKVTKKSPSGQGKFELTKAVTSMKKRLLEIQQWMGMDDEAKDAWEKLSIGFLQWLATGLEERRIEGKVLFTMYPTLWTRYLKETGQTDHIGVQTVTTDDDPDKPLSELPDEDGELSDHDS
ncbi:hypothetical protein BV898_15048 [Hypsibius exemplaris]|uniref:DUF7920 domain-containing protein n=1 Tax=Hypsibius exemplaris TaxID=2072580 RepID=A0A9X6N9Q1_HYPEX|nr:hypothetical protein BV898_15048 [Hypsibius exemplaris]